jgi:hypothetical protein
MGSPSNVSNTVRTVGVHAALRKRVAPSNSESTVIDYSTIIDDRRGVNKRTDRTPPEPLTSAGSA